MEQAIDSMDKGGLRLKFDLFDFSARALLGVTWISGAVFAAYIAFFFGGAAYHGLIDSWNSSLPGLYDAAKPMAVAAIGSHFAAGAILLLLGPIQFFTSIRTAIPAVHRWLGRLYIGAAALAGVGGLAFILVKGTIGGPVMDIGFGIYGALMVLCAERAFTNARQRRFDIHRAWAIRLFALTVGSWLYRMEYAFWHLTMDGIGTNNFLGWFDMVMAFFFYVPNLVVAEAIIRSTPGSVSTATRTTATILMLAATIYIAIATWLFSNGFWGMRIVEGMTGNLS